MITHADFEKFELLYSLDIRSFGRDFNIWKYNDELYLEIFSIYLAHTNSSLLIKINQIDFVYFLLETISYDDLISKSKFKYRIRRTHQKCVKPNSIKEFKFLIEDDLCNDDFLSAMPTCYFEKAIHDDNFDDLIEFFPEYKTLILFS